jgi:uncharacterized protein YcbK (DUF882 family)
MGDLSKNFSTDEFRCKGADCCDHQFSADIDLVLSLQKLRDLAGVPIKINCAYRCPKHNKAVGGVLNSFHCQAMAADIVIQGKTPQEAAALADQIPRFHEGGIGIYKSKGFIHVDIRKGLARWVED